MPRRPSQESIPPIFRLPEWSPKRSWFPLPKWLCRPTETHDLFEISIDGLQKLYSENRLTSAEYVAICLERIRKVDSYLEAVIEVNPDALQIAAKLDHERRRGRIRGPLHGVPILVKDNIATKDSMQTTAGSWALLGSVVPRDAHVVSQLRDAGAIILGHANMSEWASVRSSAYSTGYSPRRGQVRNPFDLSSSPFGSSGGSAVAVSANLVPISLGTETDTSIIGPALINGVVGVKPTVGLTSRSGVIPISRSMDTVGCFGRTVLDAAYTLTAITRPDDRDDATKENPNAGINYANFVSSSAVLRGAKFGLPHKRCWEFVPADQAAVALEIIDAIAKAGGEVITVDFPCAEDRIPEDGSWDWEYGKPAESEFTVVKVEAYNGINEYLSELRGTDVKCLEDVVAYNVANCGTEGAKPGDHAAFPQGQDNFHKIVEQRGNIDETYQAALRYIRQKSREEGIDAALKVRSEDGSFVELDALIMCDRRGVGQQMAAQAGYPIVCIPIGLDVNGLPIGLSFIQSAWKEASLIKWASAVEDLRNQVTGWRPTPGYRCYNAKNIPIANKHRP